MAFDFTESYNWSLSLLHQTEPVLPQVTFQRFLDSSLRTILADNLQLKALVAADTVSEEDLVILDEAVGYKAVALWLMSPPAPGMEVVLRQELANGLLEQYQGWKPEDIAKFLSAHADDILGDISVIDTAWAANTAGRKWVMKASPTRANNTTRDSLFGQLFSDSDGDEF
jgi:hypothetical protein